MPTLEGVSIACRRLSVFLQKSAVPIERHSEIELVTAEALNNCVEHGLGSVKQPKIELSCTVTAPRITVQIVENGEEYAMPSLRDAHRSAESSVRTQRDGGFGWHLIHSLADEVSLRRAYDRNQLTLEFVTSSLETSEINHV